MKKIINHVIIALSFVALFLGYVMAHALHGFDLNKATTEMIFFPLVILGKFSLPIFTTCMFLLNIKKESLLLIAVFLIIGTVVTAISYANYEDWRELLEINKEDKRFQTNFSGQLSFILIFIVQGGLTLSAGVYFIICNLRSSDA